jgi:hypothetical protein
MCLWIPELVMLGGGLYVLITGKIPGFLLGGHRSDRYEVSEGLARFLGFLMILPIPCAFMTGVLMRLTMDPSSVKGTAIFAEVAIVVGTAILVLIIYTIARTPVDVDPSCLENGTDGSVDKIRIADDINRKINGSLIYVILSALGFAAIVTCPLAILRITKAIKLIDTHQVGEEHRQKAQIVRRVAILSITFWILAGFGLLYLMLYG